MASNAWKFDCTSTLGGNFPYPDPTLTHRQGVAMNQNNLITQARLSVSPSYAPPHVALDLFVVNGSHDPATVTGIFQGYGEILAAPIRDVSPLDSTKVVTLNFANGT